VDLLQIWYEMRRSFHFFAETPLNNLTYAVLGACWLGGMHLWGDALWTAWAPPLGLVGIVVGLGFALYLAVFWLYGGFFIWLDAHRTTWLERYRIQTGGRDRPDVPLGDAVPVVLKNQFFGTLPVLFMFVGLLHLRGVSVDSPVPLWWVSLLHLGGFVLVEEVLFYSMHRLLHVKPLFRKIHRIHHLYRQPIGITTHYVHFAEHLFGNLLPIFAGPVLFGAHPTTILLWTTIAVLNAIQTHSNYAFWWMGYAPNHDHHHYNVTGNYGVLGWLDWLFGTDRPFRAVKDTSSESG
jgi:fatty acid hydroxylase domain-containing protein 2